MSRRSTIDAILEDVLCELETELEGEGGEKLPFRWWVSRREFGSAWEIVNDLSTQEENHTPEDAMFRHSAVMQMAYKQLRARGFKSGEVKVERFLNTGGSGRLDKRGPDSRGRQDSGCSTADLGRPLRIYDCVLSNR